MKCRVVGVLKYSDASDDVYILVVQFFYKRFHISRSASLGYRRLERGVCRRECKPAGVVLDINNNAVQLRTVNKPHQIFAERWSADRALRHINRAERYGRCEMRYGRLLGQNRVGRRCPRERQGRRREYFC